MLLPGASSISSVFHVIITKKVSRQVTPGGDLPLFARGKAESSCRELLFIVIIGGKCDGGLSRQLVKSLSAVSHCQQSRQQPRALLQDCINTTTTATPIISTDYFNAQLNSSNALELESREDAIYKCTSLCTNLFISAMRQ